MHKLLTVVWLILKNVPVLPLLLTYLSVASFFFVQHILHLHKAPKKKKSIVCLIYLDICASWKIMMERVFSFQNTFFPTLCNFIHTVIHNDLSSPLCFCPLFKAHLYALALYWYFFPSWGADSFLDFYWIMIVCVFFFFFFF